MANISDQRLKRVEEKLAQASEELTTAIHADQILLMHIERVASHCTQVLRKLQVDDSRQYSEDELSRISENYDIINQDLLNMTSLQVSDPSSSDCDLLRATSESTGTTTSVLLARELFPSEESPTKTSSSSSSTSNRSLRRTGDNNAIINCQERPDNQLRS